MNHSHKTSKPYQKFTKTLGRSVKLGNLYLSQHDKNIPANGDLVRSGIVLSVASMETYFKDKFADLIVPAMKKVPVDDPLGKALKQLLQSAGLDLRQCVSLLMMPRPYRRIRTLVTSYLGKKPTQSLKAIDDLYLCFKFKNFCAIIEGRLGRKDLLKRIKRLVERRHRIVHDGDYNKHQKLCPVDAREVRYMSDLHAFVKGAEEFLNEKFK